MKLKLKRGTTLKLLRIFIQDSSSATGAGKTALTYSGITWWYIREADSSATQVTLCAGSLGTYTNQGAAGTGGGFILVSDANMPGLYEISVPNACLSSTAGNSVQMMLTGTGIVPVLIEIELDAVDYQDGIHFGLTGVPNAAAGASGGMIINGSNAGTITLAALTVTGALTVSGGVTISNSTTNGVGLSIVGNGSGAAIAATGGATGNALTLTGGATSGFAYYAAATGTAVYIYSPGTYDSIEVYGTVRYNTGMVISNTATNGSGLTLSGNGSGAGLAGSMALSSLTVAGAVTVGGGVAVTNSTTDGNAIIVTGNGAGSGFSINGGATGTGLRVSGGATSGDAFYLFAVNGFAVHSGVNSNNAGWRIYGAGSTYPAIELNGTGIFGSLAGDLTGKILGGGSSSITGTGVWSNLTQILGTGLTETNSGQLAGGVKKLFDVASPTGTLNSLPAAAPGAVNGLMISGSNAGTTTFGAITVTSGIAANITGNLAGNVTGSVGMLTDTAIDSFLDLADAVDGQTLRAILRGMAAAIMGKEDKPDSNTVRYFAIDDSKVRISADISTGVRLINSRDLS